MKRTVALLVAAVVGVYLFAGRAPQPRVAAAADTPPSTNGIVVDGAGHVSGVPDVLRAVMGVNVTRGDVSSALDAANRRQAHLTAVLVHDGVAAKDIQTADVNVYPAYDRRGRPDGYQVSETLTAKLRNLRLAGHTITDAVRAAGSEAVLQGVSFALEDNAALLGKARDAAFADAKAKAQRYAELSGRTLGDVQLITETTAPAQPPYDGRALAFPQAAAGLAPVPISPGTTDISVSVTVRWALR